MTHMPMSHLLLVCLQLSPHRVEVAVMCWPITLDRDDNYWTVLYCLQVINMLMHALLLYKTLLPYANKAHSVHRLLHPLQGSAGDK